jgi:hypothetical protein
MESRGEFLMTDDAFIDGLVSIHNGDLNLIDVHNKFTNLGLLGILSCVGFGYVQYYNPSYWRLPSNTWSIYLGSNIASVTTPTMTALTSPIGSAPGTAPNTKTMSIKSGATDGIWEVTWTATWTAGLVSGVVGELGLYLTWSQQSAFRWNTYNTDYNPGQMMGSRLSVADGEFTQFTLDNTKPLAIDWKIRFSFS